MDSHYDCVVIGGGAAGFFAAINLAELKPNLKIAIIEKNVDFLQKVKVSGGGRCNVTNACSEPEKLMLNYPRGGKWLLEPFQRFGSKEVVAWFKEHQVELVAEKDGRIFPKSNSSSTIIDCFMSLAKKYHITLIKSERVEDIELENNIWSLKSKNLRHYTANNLIITTGSDSRIWEMLQKFDINIVQAVPSLFTFNIKDENLHKLAGISLNQVKISLLNSQIQTDGPILITHTGISGPAVLKLSAWGAREMSENQYQFKISINWIENKNYEEVLQFLKSQINEISKKNVIANPLFGISARFWKYLCEKSEIKEQQKWAEMGKKHCANLAKTLSNCEYQIFGKNTFKEEFVTAGGVDLAEIDSKSFKTHKIPNLFLAGEVLNIDAVTGGFNFQAAWTGGWHIAQTLGNELN